MKLREVLFALVCDFPGITDNDIHQRLLKHQPRFLRFLLRWREAIALWHLEDDGQIMYVAGEGGQRHYYPADGSRFTDHRL